MSEKRDEFLRLDPEIKEALVADVAAKGSNMNSVAVSILADHFGVPYAPSGRRGTPGTEATMVLLSIPRKLRLKIGQRALAEEKSRSEIIQGVLAAHYGLRYFPPTRGRRPTRAIA